MIKNKVKILRGSDLTPMFEDIKNRYGFDFIAQFKVSKALPK